MKKIFNIITPIFAFSLIFFSCESDDMDEQNFKTFEQNTVHFKTSTERFSESEANVISIVAFYSSTNHTSDVSAEVSVEGNSSDYQLVDSDLTLDFPVGIYSDTIKVKLNNNFDSDSNRDLVFKINSVSNGSSVGYPGEQAVLSTYTLSIIDDDCPFDPMEFVGIPTGTDNYGTTSHAAGVQFTLDSTTEVDGVTTKAVYSVTGLMSGQFAAWEEPVSSGGTFKLELDNSDPVNPVVRIYELSEDPYGLGRNDFYADTDGGSTHWGYFLHDKTEGVNTFSTCNKTLTFTYWVDVLRVSDGNLFEEDSTGVLNVQF